MYPDIIIQSFQNHFGEPPALVVRAPGRINLIGEHTDYNQGFVLPAAIDRAIWLAVSPRTDDQITLYAQDVRENYMTSLEHLHPSGKHWPDYLLGVFQELQKDGHAIRGAQVVFGGDLPTGAGLSSSAALESGMLFALNELYALGLSRTDLARLAQRSENTFVGVPCGIMDMFASLMGRQGQAIQLDCRNLQHRYIPFQWPDHTLVLCNSGVKHRLGQSEYPLRRQQCEAGVRILQTTFPEVHSLRDATPDMLAAKQTDFPEVVWKRCQYVVKENARVLAACRALEAADLPAFGVLLYEAHWGAQHEFEISCAEIDFLIEQARAHPGVLGSRMMGGGFGGCTINLVQRSEVADFQAAMIQDYQQELGRTLVCWEVALTDGVEIRRQE